VTFALWLGLLSLPAAAVATLAVPRAARALAGAGLLAAAGGVAAVARETANGRVLGSRGFEVDLWRAGLALAVIVVCAAPVVRGGADDAESPYRWTVFLGTAAAGVASLLAADTFSFAAFLVASTLGFGVLCFVRGSRVGLRACVRFAASDLVAVTGLVLVAAEGMRVPPPARGAGAAALLTAAVVRGGVFPGTRWFADVLGEDTAISAVALGVMRAQALALVAWVSSSGSEWGTVMAVAAALSAAVAARHAMRESSVAAAGTAQFAMVVAAFGLAGASAVQGAVLLAAGMFLAAVIVVGGRAQGWVSPTVGAAPLGATLPGAALVATAAFSRALGDRPMFVVALPLAAALVWLAQAGVSGMRARGEAAGGTSASTAWFVAPAAVIASIAVAPGAALAAIATAALASGASRLVVAPLPAIPNELGIVFVVAAAGVAAAGLPRGRSNDCAASVLRAPGFPLRDPSAVRAVVVIGCLVVGWLAVLFVQGVRRGFL